jgi:heme-degrading monooxygenase HmoA
MVRFINCFEVPPGRDEDFLAIFTEVNTFMAGQPGYLGHRLHRALAADARYRFVNHAEWASADDWARAHGDEFRRLVVKPEWAWLQSTAALYEVVHEGRAPGS